MGTRKKLSKSKNFVLADPNDYTLAKNALRILFETETDIKSLIISKNKKVIGFIYEKYKIIHKKLDDFLQRIFSCDPAGEDFNNLLKEIRENEILGFQTIEI